MRIAILILFTAIFPVAIEPTAVTLRAGDYDAKERAIKIEKPPRNCKKATHFIIKGVPENELIKIAERLKGKKILGYIEKCQKILILLPPEEEF